MMKRLLFVLLVFAAPLHAQTNPDWHRAIPGFKIAGNLYYVGTADLAVYLIATPQGNVLINSDFPEDVPTIRKSIEQLGFKYADTKILLSSHAHGDHDAATSIVQKETGARVMVMDGDVAEVESTRPGRPGARVDRVLHDGDTVMLGGSTLTAHLTPGHTQGCTTWTTDTTENGKRLQVAFVCSVTINEGVHLVGNTRVPSIADHYARAFRILRDLRPDVFVAEHGGVFGLEEKAQRAGADGAANPFVDREGYRQFVERSERAYLTQLRAEQRK